MSRETNFVERKYPTGAARVILSIVFGLAVLATGAILVRAAIAIVTSIVQGRYLLEVTGYPFSEVARVNPNGYDPDMPTFQHVIAFATAASIAQVLTQAACTALVAVMAWRLLHRRPFRRSLSTITTAGGIVVFIGGAFTQGLGLFTDALANSSLPSGGADSQGGNGTQTPAWWPFPGTFDSSFIALGIVLILVGLAFRYSQHLQHDTEGLI